MCLSLTTAFTGNSKTIQLTSFQFSILLLLQSTKIYILHNRTRTMIWEAQRLFRVLEVTTTIQLFKWDPSTWEFITESETWILLTSINWSRLKVSLSGTQTSFLRWRRPSSSAISAATQNKSSFHVDVFLSLITVRTANSATRSRWFTIIATFQTSSTWSCRRPQRQSLRERLLTQFIFVCMRN